MGMTSSSGIRSTGEKKCMPRMRSGRRALAAISANGNSGSVGGEDGVGSDHRFDFRQHPALDVEILEHRFDHQVGSLKSAVVGRAREQRAEPLVLGTGEPSRLQSLVSMPVAALIPSPLGSGRHPCSRAVDLDIEHGSTGDSRSHEPGADDAQPPDLPGACASPEEPRRPS